MDSAPGPSGLCLYTNISVLASLAGKESSSNGSSDTPKLPKKRPEDRKAGNTIKQRRRGRKEKSIYMSPTRGKLFPLSIGPPCTCKKRCFELISDNEKQQLLEAFNGLANKDLQDVYLFGLIVSNEIKRCSPRGASARSARRASYTYHVRVKIVLCAEWSTWLG